MTGPLAAMTGALIEYEYPGGVTGVLVNDPNDLEILREFSSRYGRTGEQAFNTLNHTAGKGG